MINATGLDCGVCPGPPVSGPAHGGGWLDQPSAQAVPFIVNDAGAVLVPL
jgi:hypothetical protein